MPDNQALIELLKQGMQIEYSFIWHYPRLARLIVDAKARDTFNTLGEASVHHAGKMSQTLRSLGASPEQDLLAGLSELKTTDIPQVLANMLENEKTAARLYAQAAELAKGGELRTALLSQVSEEMRHIEYLNQIIRILRAEP
jgi:rubrerythrin